MVAGYASPVGGRDRLTHFCYRCYGENDRPTGPCSRCGQPIEPPPGTGYGQLLVWALDHPLPDVAMRAAAILGKRGERDAARPLRRLALSAADPFLAAQALRSLVAIEGADALLDVLERLAYAGPAPVRRAAQDALLARLAHSS